MPETKMAPEKTGPENTGEAADELFVRVAPLEQEPLRPQPAARSSVEDAFRLLADAAPVMIWAAAPDGSRIYLNKTWLEFRGRTLEQELGNGWWDGVHPDDRELCLATHSKCFEARQRFRMEYRLMHKDGDYRWVETTGVPRLDGEMYHGFLGSAADVTQRRAVRFAPDEHAVRIVFSLTERERQVLMLIAEGHSTKEAALRLGISYKTADSHRSRILEKLGVHETASMVRYAIRAGLIAP
jgi:PAS domain S-box-containing protein